MYAGQTLFAQPMDFVPRTAFARLVARYGGDKGMDAVLRPDGRAPIANAFCSIDNTVEFPANRIAQCTIAA